MKTNIVIVIIATLLINTSCKKETGKKESCRITKLTYNGALVYDIKYGDNEKISSIETMPGNEKSSYKYEKDKTTITYTTNNNFDYRMIVTTNKNGFATNVRMEFDQAGTKWVNQAFTFDGNKVMKNDATEHNGGSATVNYTWANGNISALAEENDIIDYTYYTDQKFQPGEWRDIQQLLAGYKIYEYKNLLESQVSGGKTTNYTYLFDDKGRIAQAKSTSTSVTYTFDIEYECQ